jgi:hypothetical protein
MSRDQHSSFLYVKKNYLYECLFIQSKTATFIFPHLRFRALSKINSVGSAAAPVSPDRMCDKMRGSLIKKQVRECYKDVVKTDVETLCE